MIDELPGFASEMTAHEEAIQAAITDGWQIKGFSITYISVTMPDTLMIALLWKDDVLVPAIGPNYGPKRDALKACYVERMAPAPEEDKPVAHPKAARKK